MADIFASTTGNDANSGSELSPKTLKGAITAAVAGDVVRALPGTYAADTTATTERAFNPAVSGTSGNPITIMSHVPREAIIYQPDHLELAIGIDNRSYITVKDFFIDGMLKGQVGNFLIFEGNEVITGALEYGGGGDTSLHWGIAFTASTNDSIIRNNRVHSPGGFGNGSHNTAAIMVKTNSHRNVVENNWVDCGDGVWWSGFGGQKGGGLEDNIWRYNYGQNGTSGVIGMGATNCTLESLSNLVYQNVFVNFTNAVELDHASKFWSIYNNTAYNCTRFMYDLRNSSGCPASNEDNEFWNNLAARSSSGGAVYDIGPGNSNTLFADVILSSNYNLLHNYARIGQWGNGGSGIATLGSWQSTTGFDANSIVGDPLFVDAAAGDFHLQGGSPALGAGLSGANIGAYITGSETIGPDWGNEGGGGGSPSTALRSRRPRASRILLLG